MPEEDLDSLTHIRKDIKEIKELVLTGLTENTSTEYPNLFTLKPKIILKGSASDFHSKYELQLFCSCEDKDIHKAGKGYEVDIPREALKSVSPFVNNVIQVLRKTAPFLPKATQKYIGQL